MFFDNDKKKYEIEISSHIIRKITEMDKRIEIKFEEIRKKEELEKKEAAKYLKM